jgi:hypothetical protein
MGLDDAIGFRIDDPGEAAVIEILAMGSISMPASFNCASIASISSLISPPPVHFRKFIMKSVWRTGYCAVLTSK